MPPEALTLLNFWLCTKTEQASLTSKESEGRKWKSACGKWEDAVGTVQQSFGWNQIQVMMYNAEGLDHLPTGSLKNALP